MIKTFEEFESYYKKNNKTPNMISKPKNPLNNKQLLSKWISYQKPFSKEKKVKKTKIKEIDTQWEEVSILVHARDKEQCQLLKKLKVDNIEAYMYILSTYMLTSQLDLAHVIPRSASKNLYYNPDNLRLLNRASHSMLDSYHDPITGKAITKEEVRAWWMYIIGEENYNNLIERK